MVLEDQLKMELKNSNIKISAKEEWYVWNTLSREVIEFEDLHDIVEFEVLEYSEKPDNIKSVFIHMFNQINNSSEKISIYFYTALLSKINKGG